MRRFARHAKRSRSKSRFARSSAFIRGPIGIRAARRLRWCMSRAHRGRRAAPMTRRTPRLCDPRNPPTPLAFDHAEILADYVRWLETGEFPAPWRKRQARARAAELHRAANPTASAPVRSARRRGMQPADGKPRMRDCLDQGGQDADREDRAAGNQREAAGCIDPRGNDPVRPYPEQVQRAASSRVSSTHASGDIRSASATQSPNRRPSRSARSRPAIVAAAAIASSARSMSAVIAQTANSGARRSWCRRSAQRFFAQTGTR